MALAQQWSMISILLFLIIGIFVAVFVGRAITRLVRQLEISAQEKHDMMANSLDVICTVDGDGKFVHCERRLFAGVGLCAGGVGRALLFRPGPS